MSDIAEFVRGFGPQSSDRIRCACPVGPLDDLPAARHPGSPMCDPNLSFREDVLRYVFGWPPPSESHRMAASDDLIQDLFVATWQYAAGHDYPGLDDLAEEALRRGCHAAFAQVFALPMGSDQHLPLRSGMQRVWTMDGESSRTPLLQAIEAQLKTGTDARRQLHLNSWHRYIVEKDTVRDG